MVVPELLFIAFVFFCFGGLIGHINEKTKGEKKLDALKRTMKCFYDLKSNEKAMEVIIKDAIALGIDFDYIEDSYDLYRKWECWRNYGVLFPTKVNPKWLGLYKSNGKRKFFKLSNRTIYIPNSFEPVGIDLKDYKDEKSYNNHQNLL